MCVYCVYIYVICESISLLGVDMRRKGTCGLTSYLSNTANPTPYIKGGLHSSSLEFPKHTLIQAFSDLCSHESHQHRKDPERLLKRLRSPVAPASHWLTLSHCWTAWLAVKSQAFPNSGRRLGETGKTAHLCSEVEDCSDRTWVDGLKHFCTLEA